MILIPLTQGQFTLVDDEDFEFLNHWKWYLKPHFNTFYAARKEYSDRCKSKQTTIYMHRVIVSANRGELVDHRDRQGLNNFRSNLRISSPSGNSRNSGIGSKNISGFKGVFWNKQFSKWTSFITVNGKRIYLGMYDNAQTASDVRDLACSDYHGEFASLNSTLRGK